MDNLNDALKTIAYNVGRTAAKEGVGVFKNKPEISQNVVYLFGDMLLVTGVLTQETKKPVYLVHMKTLIDAYTQGYFSILEEDRKAAQAKFANNEDKAAAQRVVDLIQKHFPGSIVVPL